MNSIFRTKGFISRTFSEIWPEVTDFASDYQTFNEGIIDNSISESAVNTLYCLLFARFADSHIASRNEYQFKTKLFSTIFMYGPTWEKRLEIQKAIRSLSTVDPETGKLTLSADLVKGGKAIYNTALNPSQPVYPDNTNTTGTNTLTELEYINQQNTTNYQKSLPEAYAILSDLLETDVTKEFIDKFKKLFWYGAIPNQPIIYNYDSEDIYYAKYGYEQDN